MNKFDYKALAIGALIYFIGSFLLIGALAILIVEVDMEIKLTGQLEYYIELISSIILILIAGFYTYMFSKLKKLNQSVVLGIILFLYHFPGTIMQFEYPDGDPFLWNIIYDTSLILFAYLGSVFAIRKMRKDALQV